MRLLMTRRRPCSIAGARALALLLAFGLAPAAGSPDAAPAEAADAGTAAAPDAAPALELPEADPAARDRLAADVAALRQAALGEGTRSLRQLFDVDLLDEVAVAAHARLLRARIDEIGARLDAAAARPDESPALALEILTLERERARLRLGVLEQPRAAREALLARETEQRRLALAQEAAARERAQAESERQRAEEARRLALEAALAARTEAARALADERARVEAKLTAYAEQKAALATASEQAAAALRQHQDALAALRRRADAAGPDEARRLYAEAGGLLADALAAFSAALTEIEGPLSHAPYEPTVDPGAATFSDPALATSRESLGAALERARAEHETLAVRLRETRWTHASAAAERAFDLNAFHQALLPRLAEDDRDRVLGLGRDGVAQLLRELRFVELAARWYPHQRRAVFAALKQRLGDALSLGETTGRTLQFLLVIAAWFVLARRRLRLLAGLRALVARSPHRALFAGWIGLLAAIDRPLLAIVGLKLLFAAIDAGDALPEAQLLETLLLAYAWYRVVLGTLHHALTSAARTRRVDVTVALSRRILRSFELAGGYAFAVYTFTTLSAALVGEGYLYRLAVDFTWLGFAVIAVVLLARWRDSIEAAYLRMHPGGWLAARMRRAGRGRLESFGVATAALGFVAVKGVGGYVRDLALRFDRTRRALAFLFRRQLQKSAQARGHGSTDISALPPELCAMLDEGPAGDLAVDHFPGLGEAVALVERWRDGGEGESALALTGEHGCGKSMWMRRLAERVADVPHVELSIDARLLRPRDVLAWLGEALGVGPASTPKGLADALRARPPALLLVEHAHNLVLRALGGLDGYAAFAEVVGRTAGHHFWVCAFATYPHAYVRRAFRGLNPFDRVLRLDGWSEEDIGALIDRRMSEAGFTVTYEDLLDDAAAPGELELEAARTAERYRRLLWDYAAGNPRIALHFWLRSLVPDGERRLRVRLFEAPSEAALEALSEQERFLLQAVVLHDHATPGEAAASLGYPVDRCELTFEALARRGILRIDPRDGAYHLTTRWFRAVTGFLARKHLIYES